MIDNANIIYNLPYVDFIVNTLKILYINIFTYYTFIKLLNKQIIKNNFIVVSIITLIISILSSILEYKLNSFTSMLCLVFLLTILYAKINKNTFAHSLLITIISLSFNYIILFLDIIISFLINIVFIIPNDYLNLCIMFLSHLFFVRTIFKIPRFKNGLSILKNKLSNEYAEVFILNISVTILFCFIVSNNFNIFFTTNLISALVIYSIITVITIQKTLTMYYKHKLLVTELNDTKSELEGKNK